MSTSRRAVLLIAPTVLVALTACSRAPMDADELNRAVTQVDGVTHADLKMEEGGGLTGWAIRGEVGLPDDEAQAMSTFRNCLQAIAGVDVRSGANVHVYVTGVSSSGAIGPEALGLPSDTNGLKEHFS
ncbi:hypothetical protein [Janibacter anophelis]|uniref:hypothetical protein n=1 Tax=Janibacter anophelis TaxID=319054 RepID=UPI00082D88C4|nr:hypothetical protein [Janibacter anophelis]